MKLLPSISPTQRSPNPPQRSPTLRPRGNHGTNNNSSTKSTPSLPLPSSIVQREEEALERELEIWISQHQHTLQPLHHHQQPTPNVTSSFNRQKSQQVNPFELHIPLHTSQLHNGTLRQMAKQHPKQERSLMDEPGTEESNHFEAAAHPQHINHAYNAKTLYPAIISIIFLHSFWIDFVITRFNIFDRNIQAEMQKIICRPTYNPHLHSLAVLFPLPMIS